jgi:hypothetical protein
MKPDEDIPPDELAANNEAKATVRIVFFVWLVVIAVIFALGIWLVACLKSSGG